MTSAYLVLDFSLLVGVGRHDGSRLRVEHEVVAVQGFCRDRKYLVSTKLPGKWVIQEHVGQAFQFPHKTQQDLLQYNFKLS